MFKKFLFAVGFQKHCKIGFWRKFIVVGWTSNSFCGMGSVEVSVLLEVSYTLVDRGCAGVFEQGQIGHCFADLPSRLRLLSSQKTEYGAVQLSPSDTIRPKSYALLLFLRQSFQFPLLPWKETRRQRNCLITLTLDALAVLTPRIMFRGSEMP